jgi:transcriptional regulator with XRE-family HTH domain
VTEESLAFNDCVRKRRLELGLSQKEVSLKLGFKHAETINLVETGEREPPLDRFPDLADALCLDRTELCRMFLKETAPKFNEALFAQLEKSHKYLPISQEQPKPC